MADKPTVFVVDDDPGALRSLCWLIEQADMQARAFASGREFLDVYDPRDTGCLVLDVRMPGMDGLEVQRRLGELGARLPIIFISAHGDVPTCAEAFRAGAFDFLEKPVNDDQLLEHIQRALARAQRQAGMADVSEFARRLGQLTLREREVLDGLTTGKSLKEMAVASNVTVQTIWRHRLNVLQKMEVESDAELIRLATLWDHHQHL